MTNAPETLLARCPKNSSEEIRIRRTEFKGHDLVDIRVFGEFGGPARVMMPTKRGLSIQAGQLQVLIAALLEAQAAMS